MPINIKEYAVKTDLKTNIILDGKQVTMDVYNIPLEYLYYNDQNDRIATFISQYESENNQLNRGDREQYNEIMHEFIRKSNPAALEKTKKNIERFGQHTPGVVLKDGRIIDGNRRFTCLRELLDEGTHRYYQAIILEDDVTDKAIKRLELNLQHGQDVPVDYNPIDFLVGVYKSIEEQKLFNVQEYANETDRSVRDIRQSLEASKLMVEFLEFIQKDKQFHIARDLTLDGPLREMVRILNKFDEDFKERAKYILFTNILLNKGQPLTLSTRDLGKVLEDEENREHFESEYYPYMEEAYDIINANSEEIKNAADLNKIIKEDLEFVSEANDIVDQASYQIGLKEEKRGPITNIRRAESNLNGINHDILLQLEGDDLEEFREKYQNIMEKMEELGALIK